MKAVSCVAFCEKTIRLRLTHGQRAFIAVAVDGRLPRELEGADRDAALEIFGDVEEIPTAAQRTIVAAFGRDSGKTELASAIAIYLLLTVDLSRVGPGDVAVAAVVAPREKTARLALRRALARMRMTPSLARLLESETKDGFTLRRPDGRLVALEVFAATRGGASLRGPSFVCVIFDEAAQFRDTDSVVNDESLYAAVMPRLLPGGLAIFLSTPWTEEGLFWKLASSNLGNPTKAIVAKGATLVMRDNDPHHVAIVAAERERDPDNAAREFDAEFMSSGGSLFFEPSSITDAIDDTRASFARADGELVGCGADIGLIKDSSAIVAVARKDKMHRLLEHLEMRPQRGSPLKLSGVVGEFAAFCKRHAASGFMADGHAREPAREYASEHKISITNAPEGAAGKYDSYVALRQIFVERRMVIPNAPRLLAQLRAVQAKPVAGGTYRIWSPRRAGQAHGDLTSALVLAVVATPSSFRLCSNRSNRRGEGYRDMSHFSGGGLGRSRGF